MRRKTTTCGALFDYAEPEFDIAPLEISYPPPAVQEQVFPRREAIRDLYYYQKAEPSAEEGRHGQGRYIPYSRLTDAEKTKIEYGRDEIDQAADDGHSWRELGHVGRYWNGLGEPHTQAPQATDHEAEAEDEIIKAEAEEIAHKAWQQDVALSEPQEAFQPAPIYMGGMPQDEPEKTQASAILYKGKVYSGERHLYALNQIAEERNTTPEVIIDEYEDSLEICNSFLTNKGRIINREEMYSLGWVPGSSSKYAQAPQLAQQAQTRGGNEPRNRAARAQALKQQDHATHSVSTIQPMTAEERILADEQFDDNSVMLHAIGNHPNGQLPEGLRPFYESYHARQSERHAHLVRLAEARGDYAKAAEYKARPKILMDQFVHQANSVTLDAQKQAERQPTDLPIAPLNLQQQQRKREVFTHNGKPLPEVKERDKLDHIAAMPVASEPQPQLTMRSKENAAQINAILMQNREDHGMMVADYNRWKNKELSIEDYRVIYERHKTNWYVRQNQLKALGAEKKDFDQFPQLWASGYCPEGCHEEGLKEGSLGHCDPKKAKKEEQKDKPHTTEQQQRKREVFTHNGKPLPEVKERDNLDHIASMPIAAEPQQLVKQEKSGDELQLLEENRADALIRNQNFAEFKSETIDRNEYDARHSRMGSLWEDRQKRLIELAMRRGDQEAIEEYKNLPQVYAQCIGECAQYSLPRGSLGHCDPTQTQQQNSRWHAGYVGTDISRDGETPAEAVNALPRLRQQQSQTRSQETETRFAERPQPMDLPIAQSTNDSAAQTNEQRAEARKQSIFTHYGRQQETNRPAPAPQPQTKQQQENREQFQIGQNQSAHQDPKWDPSWNDWKGDLDSGMQPWAQTPRHSHDFPCTRFSFPGPHNHDWKPDPFTQEYHDRRQEDEVARQAEHLEAEMEQIKKDHPGLQSSELKRTQDADGNVQLELTGERPGEVRQGPSGSSSGVIPCCPGSMALHALASVMSNTTKQEQPQETDAVECPGDCHREGLAPGSHSHCQPQASEEGPVMRHSHSIPL